MRILLTNDDGVHAGGIIHLAEKLTTVGNDVFVVAPRTEQSGVSSAITFLRPLFPVTLGSSTESDDQMRGFSVDGTPADCTKLALIELCPFQPDLVISGINGGLNAGINCGYSGTVGGALVAATFNIPSMAISLEYSTEMDFEGAAEIAWGLIEKYQRVDWPERTVLNINIPTVALKGTAEVAIVPVEINPLGYTFDRGEDPKGRPYFWSNNKPDPKPSPFETDTQALKQGKITISPITYDMNASAAIPRLKEIQEQAKAKSELNLKKDGIQ